MNNCIGYANYRSFLLCLFFLVLGGWYGLILAFIPFLQTIYSRFHTWHWIKRMQSFPLLAAPPICNKFQQPIFFNMSIQQYMLVLYPFLLSVSLVLSFFFYSHLKVRLQGFMFFRFLNEVQIIIIFFIYFFKKANIQGKDNSGAKSITKTK